MGGAQYYSGHSIGKGHSIGGGTVWGYSIGRGHSIVWGRIVAQYQRGHSNIGMG